MSVATPVKKRLFFALWPDEGVLEKLVRVRKELGLNAGKSVDCQKFHITLLFLGEVPEDKIEALKALAEQLPLAPCELTLDRLEHWVRPAVLCLTASHPPQPLTRLVEELRRGVRKLGFALERRPFRPHLTLARQVKKRIANRQIEPLPWPVHEFTLVESELDSQGSRYTVLDRWPKAGR
ncbi:MAG: RNA 2',3'-cyclic phosphodiesterase [Methylohalobius sp.]